MIKVELSASELTIEPGGTAQLTVEVTNLQPEEERLVLEIEGIDVEWYALPVPALNVPASATQSARILFRVPRAPECQAATYPFLVRARGMETGEAGVQQAVLVVRHYSSLHMELNPRRVASTFINHAPTVEVTISNLGNRDETLDLYASDPEDACAYEFSTSRVALKPGQTQTVSLVMEPVTRPVFGSPRLYPVSVTARSTEDSYVSTSGTVQLERRALLSPITTLVVVLTLFALGSYAWLRPRPAVIRSFTATPLQVVAGQSVQLAWVIDHPGEQSYISPGNIPVTEGVGSATVIPQATTTYTLHARGGGAEQRATVDVIVVPAPPPPAPEITSFTASPQRIHQGDPSTLSWQVSGASEIVLNPIGPVGELDVSREVKPEQTTEYVLAVRGRNGQKLTRSVTVEVVPPNVSLAEIKAFRAKPESIEAGQKTTLSWVVEGAATVEIDGGVGTGLPAKGKRDVVPVQTTTYTLRAIDNRGNLSMRSLTVTVTQPEPLPAEPPVTGMPPP